MNLNLLNPLSNVKTVLVGLVLSAVVGIAAGGFFYVNRLNASIDRLEKKNAELTAANAIHADNNAVLRENVRTLATSNFENWKTAKALLDERAVAQDSINKLAAANLREKQSLDRLNKRIEEMLKNPENDGPVAPVLREVMREIQRERNAR